MSLPVVYSYVDTLILISKCLVTRFEVLDLISVQNIEKRYGDLRAVADISFRISRGEIVGLLGQNGAGKTTCMKMITGYLEPTAGSIMIDGLDMINERVTAQAKLGYLAENNPLYPEMSVEEYLRFMAELRELPRDRRSKVIEETLVSFCRNS